MTVKILVQWGQTVGKAGKPEVAFRLLQVIVGGVLTRTKPLF